MIEDTTLTTIANSLSTLAVLTIVLFMAVDVAAKRAQERAA